MHPVSTTNGPIRFHSSNGSIGELTQLVTIVQILNKLPDSHRAMIRVTARHILVPIRSFSDPAS